MSFTRTTLWTIAFRFTEKLTRHQLQPLFLSGTILNRVLTKRKSTTDASTLMSLRTVKKLCLLRLLSTSLLSRKDSLEEPQRAC